ncbi:MAG: sensor histidine kinase [Gammaproteobacteria bacterium]|jgi:two-component system sensor histidine kinase AlgZ|nr:sensor histidine kinase [Gammaproteobacteria bacterium]
MNTRLPDLCTPGSVFVLVLVGLVAALIFTLAGTSEWRGFWFRFGLSVLFVEWIVLVSAALLCGLRRIGGHWQSTTITALSLAIIPLVTLLASLVVVRFVPIAPTTDTAWFVARNGLISLLASLMLVRYLVLQQRWRQQVAAEARARLDALQARIRPHFLFNALNTIASLVHDKPDQAEQATLDLSDLLRTGLRSGATHSLSAELDLVRGYLRLEALRLGERLRVEWALAEDLPLNLELPALLIQPLVENAVVHGIARLPQGGRVEIRGERRGRNRLRFEITNPLPDTEGQVREGNRMALDNIRQRLALAYEEGARLKIGREDGRFRVELTLPA